MIAPSSVPLLQHSNLQRRERHQRQRLARVLVALALLCCASTPGTATQKQTVCTITVNSADERETFRRYLPASKYEFVELVERGRPDWLASACNTGVKCDVLIISGHYDGGNEFFSDRIEAREFLPVDELERVSCSGSCPGLFSDLKEVHLFGCNTLSPNANSSMTPEILRSLVREGRTAKEAQRQWHALNAGHGESSRDRMRQIFKDVPVIYGFSSVAPLGPVAASTLASFFRTNGAREIGRGRVSRSLLGHFAPFAMTATQGMTDQDPKAAVRHDVCQFADERLSDANRLSFVHQLLQREMAQTRVHLDRIQRFATAIEAPERRTPELTQAFAAIADDKTSRGRYLDFARDADRPVVRERMLKVAQNLGWLTHEQRLAELTLMFSELHDRDRLGVTEIELACTLNQARELDGAFKLRVTPGGPAGDVAHAAVRACLGSSEAHVRMLDALVSPVMANVTIAQAYLRHRPITEGAELRHLAQNIARMPASAAQVRALDTLGRHYVEDRETLVMLIALFAQTPSQEVQMAIGGILLRADLRQVGSATLGRDLRQNRHSSSPGDDMIDALVRRLGM